VEERFCLIQPLAIFLRSLYGAVRKFRLVAIEFAEQNFLLITNSQSS
jgi:hypothetical protein